MTGALGTTLLFCPASRPDRFAHAAAAADMVIADLEDSVPPDQKESARSAVVDALRAGALDPDRCIVRINPPDGTWGAGDVEALRQSPVRLVMLPKAADSQVLAALSPWSVVGLCETAAGVLAAPDLARVSNCVGLAWGGEDLTADLGGRRSRGADGRYLPLVQQARVSVLLAAGAARRAAIDGVYLDLNDTVGLAAEAVEAVSMGFASKMAIHPRQVETIRTAFRPTPDEVAFATEVLDALDRTAGVTTVRGRMVDEPLLRQARKILASVPEEAARA